MKTKMDMAAFLCGFHEKIAEYHLDPNEVVFPVGKISDEERTMMDANKKNWFPGSDWDLDAPLIGRMSSPGKGALLTGIPWGLMGSALGAGLGHKTGNPVMTGVGAGLGGLIAGGGMGLASYLSRQRVNDDIERALPTMSMQNPTNLDVENESRRWQDIIWALKNGPQESYEDLIGEPEPYTPGAPEVSK